MAASGGDQVEIVKNVKGKSAVWQHFGLVKKNGKCDENITACLICNTNVKCSRGTTNLTSHLRRHHPSRVPRLVLSPILPADNNKPTELQTVQETSVQKQPTLRHLFASSKILSSTSERAQRITSKIARFIVKDMRPYKMVESEEFRELMAACEPRYQVPSRKTFSEIIIPKMYLQVYDEVKNSLKQAELVALTTDGWSYRATESYMTITSSHIDGSWTMRNYVLQTRALPESHTGDHVASVLQAAVDEWSIPTGQTAPFNPPLVSDNISNMIKAAESFNTKAHIRCYAHTLNLAAQKCLKVKRVSHILARMRKIVTFSQK